MESIFNKSGTLVLGQSMRDAHLQVSTLGVTTIRFTRHRGHLQRASVQLISKQAAEAAKGDDFNVQAVLRHVEESSGGYIKFDFEEEGASTSKDVDPTVVSFLTQPSASGNGHLLPSSVLDDLLGTERSKAFTTAASKPSTPHVTPSPSPALPPSQAKSQPPPSPPSATQGREVAAVVASALGLKTEAEAGSAVVSAHVPPAKQVPRSAAKGHSVSASANMAAAREVVTSVAKPVPPIEQCRSKDLAASTANPSHAGSDGPLPVVSSSSLPAAAATEAIPVPTTSSAGAVPVGGMTECSPALGEPSSDITVQAKTVETERTESAPVQSGGGKEGAVVIAVLEALGLQGMIQRHGILVWAAISLAGSAVGALLVQLVCASVGLVKPKPWGVVAWVTLVALVGLAVATKPLVLKEV